MELDGSGVAADWTRAPALGAAPDEDLVGLRQAKNAFLANLAGFRCSEHMLGAPLDATD